ncbi:hypothetical protein RIF29_18680 [Crotalaria pallida]|uniref:RRM domain-containing protein n=1 Tax=Crotalaria pallida TaxID=3830 RepID=A0AAN9F0L2_CROPI
MASASSSSSSPPQSSSPESESDGDCGNLGKCFTTDEVVEYHMKRLNNPPDITKQQLYEHLFRGKKDPKIEELERSMYPPDDDSDDEEDYTLAPEDLCCFRRCQRSGSHGVVEYDNRCVVTGLSKNAKIEQLNKLFSQYGEIVESKIITDLDTGEPMGYGFVSFKYQQWMFDAVKGLNGNKLGDDTITVYASKLRGSPGYKDIRDDQGRFHARPPGTKHEKEHDKEDADGVYLRSLLFLSNDAGR